MKIITWNCNGAFRKKFESLVDEDADILVIQECENPAETKDINYNGKFVYILLRLFFQVSWRLVSG